MIEYLKYALRSSSKWGWGTCGANSSNKKRKTLVTLKLSNGSTEI